MMPVSFGALPFDCVFFAGGVAAKRGGWLEVPLASTLPEAAFATVASVAMMVGRKEGNPSYRESARGHGH